MGDKVSAIPPKADFDFDAVKPCRTDPKDAAAWSALCAKIGQPEAAIVNIADNAREMHEQRKTLRRAMNTLTASNRATGVDEAAFSGIQHAGSMIARINIAMEALDGNSSTAKQGMNVMRSATDFRSHYSKNSGLNQGRGFADSDFDIADFFRGVAGMSTNQDVRNALSVGTDTAGGFTVPSRVMPEILSALVPVSSLMRAGAGIVPMDIGAKTFTTAAVNTIPTAAWRAEAAALATSDPTFRAITTTPRSLAFQVKVSRELLADAPNMEEALRLAIAQSFARELDRVGLLGTGTAPEPRGVLNTAGIQSVTNGANGAALAGYANIFSAAQAILQADAPMPTAAVMSPRSLIKLGGLLDTTNQPLRIPGMLEPVKMIATSQISNTLTVGTSADCSQIFVGDFTNLFFMMRESLSVQMLNELYAGTGEIGFACHMRVDVVLAYPAAFAAVTGVRP